MKYFQLFSRNTPIIRSCWVVLCLVQFIVLSEGCVSEFGGYELQDYVSIRDLKIDPKNSNILYIATEEGLYKSSNGGDTWEEKLDDGIYALAISHIYSDTIYALGHNKLHKSGNAGTSWQTLDISFQVSYYSKVVLVLDPIDNQTLYAGVGSGLYKSIDGGVNWTNLKPNQIKSIAIDHRHQGIIYIVGDDGLLKSMDYGVTWTKTETGLNGTVQVIEMDPLNSETLFCGTTSGLFKSSDGAGTWVATNLNSSILSVAIDQENSKTLYACGQGSLFRSDANGENWREVNMVPLLTRPNFDIISLKIDPDNSDIIYLATSYRGVLKSADAGKSWEFKQVGLPPPPPGGWDI